jgi:hypothetical protein
LFVCLFAWFFFFFFFPVLFPVSYGAVDVDGGVLISVAVAVAVVVLVVKNKPGCDGIPGVTLLHGQ